MRILFSILVVLPFLSSPQAHSQERTQPVFAPPPRLAVTQAEWRELKEQPDFEFKRMAAIERASVWLTNPVALPAGFGEWIFYYACPDDGSRLRALNLDEHECPQCKKVYTDERTVAAYRAQQHYDAERASLQLGWAYAYSKDDRFAGEVKRILLGLAKQYPDYPARRDRWGNTGEQARLGGRRFVQSLDEAVGIISLAKSYDLTRNSPVWQDEERTTVERDLFRLTAETLLQFNQDINNHQTWYNAGLMAIASVLGDAELITRVLTMTGGYYDQLNRSIGSDGLWYEGTMAYHGYALQAMRHIVDAGRRLGLPLHEEPKLRAMILAPLNVAYPNGIFPAINDSDPISIGRFTGDFLWAWEMYREPVFAQAAAGGNSAKLKKLLGTDAAAESPLSTQSLDLPEAGVAILRRGSGDGAAAAFLDYGPHGGGHGHYDKLNLMLFANGREWLLDPGRLTYSHKEYRTWVKETVAHNTVVRNERSQWPHTGKLLFLERNEQYTACAAQSDGAYEKSVLRRYLFLTDEFLVDVFEIDSDEKAQWDWLAHAVVPSLLPVDAANESTPVAGGALGEAGGYQHLREAQRWEAGTRWDFISSLEPDAPRLRLWLSSADDETVFTAVGIGYRVNQAAPTLVRRREAASTRFVTVYDLSGQGNGVVDVSTSGSRVGVQTNTGHWQVEFAAAGTKSTFSPGKEATAATR